MTNSSAIIDLQRSIADLANVLTQGKYVNSLTSNQIQAIVDAKNYAMLLLNGMSKTDSLLTSLRQCIQLMTDLHSVSIAKMDITNSKLDGLNGLLTDLKFSNQIMADMLAWGGPRRLEAAPTGHNGWVEFNSGAVDKTDFYPTATAVPTGKGVAFRIDGLHITCDAAGITLDSDAVWEIGWYDETTYKLVTKIASTNVTASTGANFSGHVGLTYSKTEWETLTDAASLRIRYVDSVNGTKNYLIVGALYWNMVPFLPPEV
jgi:hypothetical protein